MTFKGALAGCRPWTDDERDGIRSRYVREGAAVLAREFGRTVSAINHKAQRMGVIRHRRWTSKDDATLRDLWGDLSLKAIARRLARTPATTYWRASVLGLERGCVDGMEYLTAAAQRSGFEVGQLWRILRAAGIMPRPSMSRPSRSKGRFHVVDPLDVDDAVAAWMATETLHSAAQARGIGTAQLEGMLMELGRGVPAKPRDKTHWRIPTTIIDAAVEARRGTESISEAARRLAMPIGTLRHRLVRAGVGQVGRKPWRVPRALADKAAAQPDGRRRAA